MKTRIPIGKRKQSSIVRFTNDKSTWRAEPSLEMTGTARGSMNSTASFPSVAPPPMTYYKNIKQEPYIVNKYIRPKGLPVHKYEAIKRDEEVEYEKRKLAYLIEEQERVRNEQIKNQYGVLRGAMIREMTDGQGFRLKEKADARKSTNLPLRMSGSVPNINHRQKLESEGPEEKKANGDLQVIKSMAH